MKLISFGRVQTLESLGIGAYPYNCNDADNYPDSEVYRTAESGGWVASHQLDEIRPGIYILRWSDEEPGSKAEFIRTIEAGNCPDCNDSLNENDYCCRCHTVPSMDPNYQAYLKCKTESK